MKMKRKTLISLIVIFVVSIALIIGLDLLTVKARNKNKVSMYKDVYQEMFGPNVTAEAQTVGEKLTFKNFFVGSNSGDEIVSIISIKENNNVIGTLYIVEGSNDYGDIKLAVAVKNKAIAKVKILSFNQTMDVAGSKDRIENMDFEMDSFSGVTSTYRLLDRFLNAIYKHAGIEGTTPVEKRELEDYFGKDYVEKVFEHAIEKDTLVEVLEITVDEQVVGYIFEVKDSGKYYDYEHVGTGSITLRVVTDAKGIILNILVPLDKYEHTKGFIKEKINPVIELFKNQNINELVTNDSDLELDGVAGATDDSEVEGTGSGLLAYKMLTELGEALKEFEFKLEYSQWFEGKYTITSNSDMTDTKLFKVDELFIGEEIMGTVYYIKDEGISEDGSAKTSFVLVVAVDKDGVIVAVDLPLEFYNHSKKGFYTLTNEYAQKLVGLNVKGSLDIDNVAGTTNSQNLIDSMLNHLRERIGEDNE